MGVIDTQNYEFDFGQYRSFSYNEILKIDPVYILWCSANLADFELDEEAQAQLDDRLRGR